MSTATKQSLPAGCRLIEYCQICGALPQEVLHLGFLPLVDVLQRRQPKYPAPLMYCEHCDLVQLGCIVDPHLVFPLEYPYTSGTTQPLRDNFADLAAECRGMMKMQPTDLVVDIGCNDGTLLSYFRDGCRVAGITPENMAEAARKKGIPVLQSFLNPDAVRKMLGTHGQAAIVTATNVLAHMEGIHEAIELIKRLLRPDGVLVMEFGYWPDHCAGLQYDNIHHEHLRYYTLKSLNHLLNHHGLGIIHARKIMTHGGSMRVYVSRRGSRPIAASVEELLRREPVITKASLLHFEKAVKASAIKLRQLLGDLRQQGRRIYGIGAPGRATVLIHYTRINETILENVLEVAGSHKIGKYIPGTGIPIVAEERWISQPPDYALILSWHFADKLMAKWRAAGFQGKFIVPLPDPHIVE